LWVKNFKDNSTVKEQRQGHEGSAFFIIYLLYQPVIFNPQILLQLQISEVVSQKSTDCAYQNDFLFRATNWGNDVTLDFLAFER